MLYKLALEKVFLSSLTLLLSSQQWTAYVCILNIYVYILLALEKVFHSSHTLLLSSQQRTVLTKINL